MITQIETNEWAKTIRNIDWDANYSDYSYSWPRVNKKIDEAMKKASESDYDENDLIAIHKKIMEDFNKDEDPSVYINVSAYFHFKIEYLFRKKFSYGRG